LLLILLQFLQSPSQEAYTALAKEQAQMRGQIDTAQALLQQEFKKSFFNPAELQQYYWLRSSLDVQAKQLDLLIQEINHLVHSPNTPIWSVSIHYSKLTANVFFQFGNHSNFETTFSCGHWQKQTAAR
jgi:hypothetical protein